MYYDHFPVFMQVTRFGRIYMNFYRRNRHRRTCTRSSTKIRQALAAEEQAAAHENPSDKKNLEKQFRVVGMATLYDMTI
jgi:hypothetical protein